MTRRHNRRSIRLPGYDYAQPGAYFVTICTQDRAHLFGDIVDGLMRLNAVGDIVHDEWTRTERIRSEMVLGAFVVMPNHVHGIVTIAVPHGGDASGVVVVGAHGRAPLRHAPPRIQRSARSLGAFVAGFKSAVTTRINAMRGTPGAPVWQRNYHEHVIRNDLEFDRIHEYIVNNPMRWHLDRNNPDRPPPAPGVREDPPPWW